MKFAFRSEYSLVLFLIASLILTAGCNESDERSPVENENTENESSQDLPWNLIFEDDFNSDLSKWNIWYGGAFNEEIQLYRQEQLSLENGILKIEIQRENIVGPTNIFDNTPKSFEYVSGRIESQEQFGPSNLEGEREYRFIARLKIPFGHGMWPAFWTYGDPWPTQGEIDILEARGGEPEEYLTNIFYGPNPNININQGTDVLHFIGNDLSARYHTYEMIWKATSIDIIFDGELIHTYNANGNNNIASLWGKKQKVVLNTAVGGLFFTDQNSDNYADSSLMEIDWVRVYKR